MKKFLLSALFALSLFYNTASAQDYKLYLALTNFHGQYLHGPNANIVDILENPSADIFFCQNLARFC